jgi:uncharacterized membrane protein YoaK (UPF0700 family)
LIFGNTSISNYSKSNALIWLILAFQGGAINVLGLMAGQHIVSHVTGIVTNFGLYLAQGNIRNAMYILVIPIFFLLGCMISGYLVDINIKLGKKPKYYLTFGIIFFLLLIIVTLNQFSFFDKTNDSFEGWRDIILISILCFVCGIQNATITTVSKSVIRTTHLTGITTDLGVGIVRLLHRKIIPDTDGSEIKINFIRLGIIISFSLGATSGGLIFNLYSYQAFFLPIIISGSLFFLMLYFQLFAKN